jgi:predicted methyltransferase
VTQQADYYAQRAAEYDAVYAKPERQHDLARLKELLPPLVAGRRVLELAAGTGYWTQVMSWSAARQQLGDDLADAATGLRWTELDYYWLAACVLR